MLLIQDTVAIESLNSSLPVSHSSKPIIPMQPMQHSKTHSNVARSKDDNEKPTDIKIQAESQTVLEEKTKPRVGSLGDSRGYFLFDFVFLVHTISLKKHDIFFL